MLEFGVRRRTSIAHIAEAPGQTVHGFDSFEGLPEGWGSHPQGNFTTELELPPVPGQRNAHPGWFKDALARSLAARPGAGAVRRYRLDIYSSARTVLTGLADRLRPGSILVFDEFIGNQLGANTNTRRSRSSSRKPMHRTNTSQSVRLPDRLRSG